jgi:hypothetical protein
MEIHAQLARNQLGLIEPVAAQIDAMTSAIRSGDLTRSRPLHAWTL